MNKNYFSDDPMAVVSSRRILYTPSSFARISLYYLQEIGVLKALQPHVSSRSNLQSYLFFMVTEGGGSIIYDGVTYELKKNSCVFIDCRKLYCHSSDPDNLWTLQWCHFNGPMISFIYEKYMERGGRPVFLPETPELFASVWQKLMEIADSFDYVRDMRINEELSSLLTLLMSESWHPEYRGRRGTKKASVLPVRDYLDEHYQDRITLDELSRIFFISKYYLTHSFKEAFGMSISGYLLNVRITHAKHMLRFNDMSIEEIGNACGIGSLHYFSRVFKEVEGVPPSTYREQW